MAAEPAYKRLENDERRRRLLELGARLFTNHSYDEISMAQIAKQAGISKALLYHYFPSKRDYFVATLAGGADQLRALVQPSADLPPVDALIAALDAYLSWVEANAESYAALFRSAGSVPEVRELVDGVRTNTATRILEGLAAAEDPKARIAVQGWLWFMDGACLHWIAHRDVTRDDLHGMLLGTLVGALMAAGVQLPE